MSADTIPNKRNPVGRPKVNPDTPDPTVMIYKTVGATLEDWEYILNCWDGRSMAEKVNNLIHFARKFAPAGPDAARPRGKGGRFLKDRKD